MASRTMTPSQKALHAAAILERHATQTELALAEKYLREALQALLDGV